jgi:hypothetical protein
MGDLFAKPDIINYGQALPDYQSEFRKAEVDQRKVTEYVEKIYKPNLREILDLHRRYGETAIFVTQPENPAIVVRKDGEVFVKQMMNGDDVTQWAVALGRINLATEAVCFEWKDICRFVDLANGIPFEPLDFSDLVYNTPKGAHKIGLFLAHELQSILQSQR